MAFSSVFYNESTRLTLQHSDVNCANLARIFNLQPESIYLCSDTNNALLPDGGKFHGVDLNGNTHYKVCGTPVNGTPGAGQRQGQGHTVPYRSPSMAGSSTSQLIPTSHYSTSVQRPIGGKVVKRKMQIVELDRGEFRCSKILILTLKSGEFNVDSVRDKIQEELLSVDDYIILDSGNREVVDSAATRERGFWSMPSRVLKAVTDVDFATFKEMKKQAKKPKLAETKESLMEVEDTLLQLVECASTAAQKDKVSVLLPCSLADIRHLQDSLSCVICKDGMEKPVASGCCKSLLGCSDCLDEWWGNSAQCPKCRAEDGKDLAIKLCGVDNTFKLLKPISKT